MDMFVCVYTLYCVLSEGASGYTLVMSLRSRKKDREVYGFIPKTFKNTLYSKQHSYAIEFAYRKYWPSM